MILYPNYPEQQFNACEMRKQHKMQIPSNQDCHKNLEVARFSLRIHHSDGRTTLVFLFEENSDCKHYVACSGPLCAKKDLEMLIKLG